MRWLFGKTRHFKFLADVGFSEEGLDHAKICFYRCQSFLFIVAIVISILLKTTFQQTSNQRQSVSKISWRLNKDEITFGAIEKNVSMVLKNRMETP